MATFTLQINRAKGQAPDITYSVDGEDFTFTGCVLSRALTDTDNEYSDGVFMCQANVVDFYRGPIDVKVEFLTSLPDITEDPEGWFKAVVDRVRLVRDTFDEEYPEMNQTFVAEI